MTNTLCDACCAFLNDPKCVFECTVDPGCCCFRKVFINFSLHCLPTKCTHSEYLRAMRTTTSWRPRNERLCGDGGDLRVFVCVVDGNTSRVCYYNEEWPFNSLEPVRAST